MKTTETTLNQEVRREIKLQNKHDEARVSPNVIAAAKAAAKTITDKEQQRPVNTITKDLKDAKPEAKPVAKKEPKPHAESNEALGERLLKEKANAATILEAFTVVYKAKSGITDEKFIQARANIYMKIATKRAEAKKAVKKAS